MSDEFHDDKIDELLELTRENNKILRSMHRRMLWSQVFTYFYWLVILGVAGSAYYFLQPYAEKYMHTYQTMIKLIDTIDIQSKALPSNLQGIFDKAK